MIYGDFSTIQDMIDLFPSVTKIYLFLFGITVRDKINRLLIKKMN